MTSGDADAGSRERRPWTDLSEHEIQAFRDERSAIVERLTRAVLQDPAVVREFADLRELDRALAARSHGLDGAESVVSFAVDVPRAVENATVVAYAAVAHDGPLATMETTGFEDEPDVHSAGGGGVTPDDVTVITFEEPLVIEVPAQAPGSSGPVDALPPDVPADSTDTVRDPGPVKGSKPEYHPPVVEEEVSLECSVDAVFPFVHCKGRIGVKNTYEPKLAETETVTPSG